MELPKPIKKSGKLTENEYEFMLTATLSEDKRTDPVILGFISSFVRCKSIPQSCKEVGISYKEGYKIRHNGEVSQAITKIIDKSAVKYGFDASEIMERTKEIVDFDPIYLQNSDGTYKSNMHDIPPEIRRSLKKLKVKNLYQNVEDMNGIKSKIVIGEMIEYEFYDKLKAAEMVGKEKKLFKNTTVVEHDVSKDMASILLASASRADDRIIEVTESGERVE